MNEPKAGDAGPLARRGSLPRTIRAVAWSLVGVRQGSEYEQDVQRINPLHLIAVGLVAVFVLVLGLIGLVNWIV
ncbi:MAG: DUF2970 domain-containing protein [Acidovorax sp.]|jgi:hypothetical protein